jgi:hypothetical protein
MSVLQKLRDIQDLIIQYYLGEHEDHDYHDHKGHAEHGRAPCHTRGQISPSQAGLCQATAGRADHDMVTSEGPSAAASTSRVLPIWLD